MSKRKLPALKAEQNNLMQHIADLMCQITNSQRKVNDNNWSVVEKLIEAWGQQVVKYFSDVIAMVLPETKVIKNEDNSIKSFEFDDEKGKLPILTDDELQTLKQLLADYKTYQSIKPKVNKD